MARGKPKGKRPGKPGSGPNGGRPTHTPPPKSPPHTPTTPTTPAAPVIPSQNLTGNQQSAFDAMTLILQQYGLGTLGQTLRNLILDGITDQASLSLALQDTDDWRKRFAGNEVLKGQGLPVLSVAEYLSVERSYAQVLKNYGMPVGFYDDPSDFADLIGKSVSSNELQQRAQMASDLVRREDPAILDQMASMGFMKGDLIAHYLDADRAAPLLQRQYQQTVIGAAARRQGLTPDNDYLGHLSELGVTEQQAGQGYGLIAENLDAAQDLGKIYGEDYGQRDFESEVFENDGAATRKRKKLASAERGAFGGSSGVGQGSLTTPTGGSY